jgi:monovalent cation:H+ antiporter-2, CPA2 family
LSAIISFGTPMSGLTENTFTQKGIIFQICVAPCRTDVITHIDGVDFNSAKLLLITTPVAVISLGIVAHAQRINPDIRIIARAEGVEYMKALYKKGVKYVVKPEFEASLEIVNQTFLNLDIPAEQLKTLTEEARRELNRPLCM